MEDLELYMAQRAGMPTASGRVMRAGPDWKRAVYGGALAGVFAGVVSWVILAAANAIRGESVWVTFKVAGFPILRERALAPGFDAGAVALGSLSHFGVSAGWGVLFGVVIYGVGKSLTVLAGALYGIVIWIGMFLVLLPAVGASQIATSVPTGMAMLMQVLFGLSVGVAFLPFQHTRPRRVPAEIRAT